MAPIATVVASNRGVFQDTSCYLHPVNRLDRQTSGGYPPTVGGQIFWGKIWVFGIRDTANGLAVFTYTLED